jgi:hypothetical protein
MGSEHQIRGASILSPFAPGRDARPALDQACGLGFNLARVFCGPLPWCGQELGHVYDGLPGYLDACGERGMNAYLAYCTEAETGYDLEAHVDTVEAIAREYPIVVLREVANEPYHDTQGERLSPERCADLAARLTGPVGYGAASDDESLDYAGGDLVPVHLDRGRDKWNMVRRVREIYACSENTGKPAFNQEPIGADETAQPGKRENDPAIFYTMGALNRLFLGGCGIFHSQAGLDCATFGPTQLACAQAYINGTRVWPGAYRMEYSNTGFTGGPVQAADFDQVVRVYSGLDGNEGFTVALGLAGSVEDAKIEWGNGWAPVDTIGSMPGVIVWAIAR